MDGGVIPLLVYGAALTTLTLTFVRQRHRRRGPATLAVSAAVAMTGAAGSYFYFARLAEIEPPTQFSAKLCRCAMSDPERRSERGTQNSTSTASILPNSPSSSRSYSFGFC